MARKWWAWPVGLSFALLACTQPQASLPADPSGAPKFGGTLNTVGEDFNDFDMVYQGKTIENTKDHGLVYDTLVHFKQGPGVDFNSEMLEPQLAERWEVSPDGRTYTYYLRKGVKFAEVPPVNGRELSAADVKWSMEYYSRTGEFADKKLPPSQMEVMYEGLDGVDALDRSTVRVRFKDAFAPFLNYSASQWMPIAARETYKADANPPLIATLVGTGPYVLDTKESLKGSRWVFSKNPTYWGGPAPYLDSIRRLIIPDDSTRRAAFQVKQIDILTATDYNFAQDVKKDNPQAVVFEGVKPGHITLLASQKRGGALADIRVRRAISLAMDRDEFIRVVYGGKGAWATSGTWPGLFTDAETHDMLRTDLAEAKRLLAEAGYAGGLKLELVPSGAVGAQEQLTQAQLKRVGIDLSFTILPREQQRVRLYNGDFDLIHGGAALGDGDMGAVQQAFHSTSSQNRSQINDPELDKLIMAQLREVNPQKRREAQRAVARRINEMVWNPGYAFSMEVTLTHPYVKNFGPHFSQGQHDAFVWLDK